LIQAVMIGAVKDGAPAARRDELFACLKSIYNA
jgi:hypothetical protein